MKATLQRAADSGVFVRVRLESCRYRCCGTGWQPRRSETTYVGRVLSIDSDDVLFEIPNDIGGKVGEVIASLAHLLEAELLVD